MTFQLGEIRNMKDPLIVLLDKPLQIKAAWNLTKLVKIFDKELAEIEEFRVNLIKKLGVEDDNGAVQVPDDKMNDFVDEFNELLGQEVEISFEPISIDALGDATISAKDMITLERLFT